MLQAEVNIACTKIIRELCAVNIYGCTSSLLYVACLYCTNLDIYFQFMPKVTHFRAVTEKLLVHS
jgi:hypothetical protein